jgi:hypothetical protein
MPDEKEVPANQKPYDTPLSSDAFIPTEIEDQPKPKNVQKIFHGENLADDPALCESAMSYLKIYKDKYKTDRASHETIWETTDWMWKCGQDETIRETERTRLDRQADNLTKTKAQKVGSTMFYKIVRSLAAQFVNVLFSQTDPYHYSSRSNPEIFGSDKQAELLANQHNLTMRWNRDKENFTVKAIEFLFQLIKYGNQPVVCSWFRRSQEVLDRWPTKKPVEGQPVETKVSRKLVLTDNRFNWEAIPIENFYADSNIADMQKQNCVITESTTNMTELLDGQRLKEYINVDQVNESHLFKGSGDNDEIRQQKETNAGLASTTPDANTGTFQLWNAMVLLPIDETAKIGKRWDPLKNMPKKFWVTVVKDFTAGVVLRIERNPDPDDEIPMDMIHHLPDDSDKLYHISLAQLIRGNYSESTTSKEQLIDTKTANINRPLKAKRGEVYTDTGDLKFGKDVIYYVENENSLTEFVMAPVNDIIPTLQYIDNDSDEAAGNNRATRGEAMGQRTSSSEAVNAYTAASLPNKMLIKYVFHQWLSWLARKGVRYWHIYAQENQTLKIADDEGVYQSIRPIDLFGDYDVVIDIVDEFEQNLMQQQGMTFAAQNLLPLFLKDMNSREAAKKFFELILHTDISDIIKPDDSEQQKALARHENRLLMDGQYVNPSPQDNHDVMLAEHKSWRLQYTGVEGDYPNIRLLDRHIAETEFLKQQTGQQTGSMTAPPENTTPGMVVGNEMAGQMGAMANGGGGAAMGGGVAMQ